MSFEAIRRWVPTGFGLRLNLWFAAVVTCVSMAVFLIAYYLLSSSIQMQDREVILAQLEVYRTWYEEGGLAGLTEHVEQGPGSGKDTFVVHLSGPDHAGLFFSLPPQSHALDLQQLENIDPDAPLNWLRLSAADSAAPWLIATTRLPGGQRLQVGKTTEAQKAILEHFRRVFAWILAVALAFGVAAGLLLTGRTLGPIRQLIHAFQQVISTGEMGESLPTPRGDDELTQLTRLFNKMLEKNRALISGMRDALDNVANDLRTPMTSLRNTAERALQGGDDVRVYREALSDTLEDSEQVSNMLTALMDISEAQTGLMRLDKSGIKLIEVINDVVEMYAIVAEDKQIKIEVQLSESVHCFADRTRLQQVIVNLLDNAIKYSPKFSAVKIAAKEDASGTSLVIEDSGIGIEPREMTLIWERLYRGDKSRAERGLGLGLSLVKAIVQAHNGHIDVDSRIGVGSTFRLWLPSGVRSTSAPPR